MISIRLEGEWLRLVGTIRKWLGQWSGDGVLRVRGERDLWLGNMEVSYAIVRRTRLLGTVRALTGRPESIRPRLVVARARSTV